jgi:lipopolysaccharide transport system permease protein
MSKNNSVWAKRGIIADFAISNLKIKYRNSVLGFIWTFLEPLLLLTVLYLVFTNVFETKIDYFPLYLLLGLIMWNMFVNGTKLSLDSILSRGHLMTQIHIPIEIPALSAAIASLIMISLELVVFGVFLVAFQFIPPVTMFVLPLVIGLNFFLVLAISMPLSVLNVRYRDTQFIWGVIIHAGFFLSPVFYKMEILPEVLQQILWFSPTVHILNFARDTTLYGKLPSIDEIGIAVGMTGLIFAIGYVVFRRLRDRIIEEI